MDSRPIIDVDLYFEWIVARVRREVSPNYDALLNFLFETEYIWLAHLDVNRADDGLYLRQQYEAATGWALDPAWDLAPCSVLEMLVALCERAEFLTDIPMSDWFWTLIENLELSDLRRMTEEDREYAANVIYCFNYRLYGKDGRGGLFPLVWPPEDQTNVELWYQLAAYINERHLV